MRKHIITAAALLMAAMNMQAQGIVITKTDGTKYIIPAEQLESITTYDFRDWDLPEGDSPEFTANGVTFKMKLVEAGTFIMGSEDSDAFNFENPMTSVTFTKDVYLSETEVTQELWEAIMGSNPAYFIDPARPVESVSWDACHEFLDKLSHITGHPFRLPTEAEWEFAARGGNKSKGFHYSGSSFLDDVAWNKANTFDKGTNSPAYGTHAVATKKPNELGIYDMSGNVSEWCEDWYGVYPPGDKTDPTGPDHGFYHVYRGGGWDSAARLCRVSWRGSATADKTYNNLGIRLALSY